MAVQVLAQTSAIDRGHLARMTFGDRSLEREVLGLFDRQAVMLIERMRGGASRVAETASATEVAAAQSATDCIAAIDRLAAAVDEARALIADLLREG